MRIALALAGLILYLVLGLKFGRRLLKEYRSKIERKRFILLSIIAVIISPIAEAGVCIDDFIEKKLKSKILAEGISLGIVTFSVLSLGPILVYYLIPFVWYGSWSWDRVFIVALIFSAGMAFIPLIRNRFRKRV